MEYLTFHVEELPQLSEAGARFVVVAYCGGWRDGEATNDPAQIPALKRKLQKAFMNRLAMPSPPQSSSIATASFVGTEAGLERV